MATIHSFESTEDLAVGLQGSDVCDEAWNAAVDMAEERDDNVVLCDDDGNWLVHPDGSRSEFDTEKWSAV